MSDVFFADLRANSKINWLDKVSRLYDAAGFNELIKPGDLVAVKVHFGEKGNTAYVRPQYVRRLVDRIKEAGGKPFITDGNTLYRGSRSNAVDHLQTAVENGWGYSVVGAPLIIADGLTGKDYLKVPIDGKHFNEVKIGAAAAHANALIAVSHFKGHEVTGFGGVLKNLGMGLGSRSGKQNMHSDILPSVKVEKCLACGLCRDWCPADAIEMEPHAVITEERCLGCGECTVTCPESAIRIQWKTTPNAIQEKIVEYTIGALKGKEKKTGYITFLMDISPECDCCTYNDSPLVGNIGILAGRDPVALDQACVDLVNSQPVLPNSMLGNLVNVTDVFRAVHKDTDWSIQLAYGEQMGLGTRKYNLAKI
ncbi:MAG: DUF362 domain-containing protein [Bacillota bacterium]